MSSCVRAWFDPSGRHRVGSRPDYRLSLADERAFLAWLRTGLALIGGGPAATVVAYALLGAALLALRGR